MKQGIQVVTPNPKTSGGARWNYLAAWAYADQKYGHDEQKDRDFVAALYHNVPVLDSGARGSTTTFAQKHIGDIHLTWENEGRLEVAEANGELELIYPPASIRAEPHVAVVDANVERKGTRAAAEAYLKFLYTDEGQEIIARHFYRPINPGVLQKHSDTLPALELFPVTTVVSGWEEAQQKFFSEGSVFDSIYQHKQK